MATPAVPPSQPPAAAPTPRFLVTIDAEALVLMAAAGWLLWEKVIRTRVVRHLDGVFAPVEEERALNDLLAQIALLAGASRVILCAFHNGQIDPGGYHLTKLSTVNSYLAEGCLPMATPILDMPMGRVMTEIEQMLAAHGAGRPWVTTSLADDLPEPCRDHLRRNGIVLMHNRLVRVGNLPIGILSLHYCDDAPSAPVIEGEPHARLIERLYERIAEIMRRRVIHPSPLRRFLYRLTGNSQSNPSR